MKVTGVADGSADMKCCGSSILYPTCIDNPDGYGSVISGAPIHGLSVDANTEPTFRTDSWDPCYASNSSASQTACLVAS